MMLKQSHCCHLFWALNCLGYLIVVVPPLPLAAHLDHVSGAIVDDDDGHDHHHHDRHHHHELKVADKNATATGPRPIIDAKFFLQQIYAEYGHDGVLTRENLARMVDSLWRQYSGDCATTTTKAAAAAKIRVQPTVGDRDEVERGLNTSGIKSADSHTLVTPVQYEKCLSPTEILQLLDIDPSRNEILPQEFMQICPAIVYEMGERHCVISDHGDHQEYHERDVDHDHHDHERIDHHDSRSVGKAPVLPRKVFDTRAFVYGALAVLFISASGLICVAVIPIIQRYFYQHFLHYFMALAIGSLTGDALLHLLPHAITEAAMEDHGHTHGEQHNHTGTVWIGLTALGGIGVFYLIERLINALTQWRQQGLPTIMVEGSVTERSSLDRARLKLKCTAYGKPNGDISQSVTMMSPNCDEGGDSKLFAENEQTKLTMIHSNNDASIPMVAIYDEPSSLLEHVRHASANNRSVSPRRRSSVIHTDHSVEHHGHGHSHSHAHEIPETVSALAWMVIAGDGLHNFSDGMAIGAAFASSIVGGLSTSIAVFCHELPHELGDFAMLLKAGMGVRQALLYNTLSSILCFFGMLVGLFIGNLSLANAWVFAAVAGMFLYIALVDMVPELNSKNDPSFGGAVRFMIHLLGLCTGITIMSMIAIYEHDLQTMFKS